MFIIPFQVNRCPCLPFRAGMTQSKKSTPRATPSIIFPGVSHAHEISGLVLRHIFLNGLDSIVHFLMSLADGQSSDSVARKVKLGNFLHVLYTNIRKSGALVYSEQHLPGIRCCSGVSEVDL